MNEEEKEKKSRKISFLFPVDEIMITFLKLGNNDKLKDSFVYGTKKNSRKKHER